MHFLRKKKGQQNSKSPMRRFAAVALLLCLLISLFPGYHVAFADDVEACTVTLHDIGADEKEILPESGKPTQISVPAGETLQQALNNQDITIGTDKTAAKDCIWYTKGDDGTQVAYDLDTTVAQDIDLYTYTYQLKLLLTANDDEELATESAQQAEEAAVEAANSSTDRSLNAEQPEGDAVDIVTERESQPLSLSEAEKAYTEQEWQDVDTGEQLDLAALETDGLTRNYTAQIATQANDEASATTVNCYVGENGEWKQIGQISLDSTNKVSGSNRFYISVNKLEEIYGGYGFEAASYDGSDAAQKYMFPHADTNGRNTIWADAAPRLINGTWHIPVSWRAQCYLYYLPHNKSGYNSYFTGSKSIDDATLKTENSWYTVSVNDPSHLIYQKGDAVLTKQEKYLYGDTIPDTTLKTREGVSWVVSTPAGELISLSSTKGDGTITFQGEKARRGLVFTTLENSKTTISYNATADSQLVKLGQHEPNVQNIISNGTVNGQAKYEDVLEASTDTYTIRKPDRDMVKVGVKSGAQNNRYLYYSFKGWKISSSDSDDITPVILEAGKTYSREAIDVHKGLDGTVHLQAVWEGQDSSGRAESVNFFVNLNCEIMDNTGDGHQETPVEKYFTDSLYSARVFGTEDLSGGANNQIILQGNSAQTAYDIDKKIRALSTTGVTKGDAHVSIESFPSDEDILRQLRESNQTIMMDGEEVKKEDMTPSNFTVRWYVFKYEHSDGWHIDGILVAKEASVIVTKTFNGDADVIADVKKNYSLSVTHTAVNANDETQDYILSLDPKGSAATGKTGYDSYDETTDTYTWKLGGRQDRSYNIKEQGYQPTQTGCNSTYRYQIVNSDEATAGWQPYPETGIDIVAKAKETDAPDSSDQLVEFENQYVKVGTLTVTKLDAETKHGLKNVSYRIARKDGESLQIYRKPNTSEYATSNENGHSAYTETVENNTIQTDANGKFYIDLPSGDYVLTETIPDGYMGARTINVTVDGGTVTAAQASDITAGATEPNDGWVYGVNTAELTIQNKSLRLLSVKAQKNWGNTPENDRKPVTVELWRNGMKVEGGQYTQVLSEKNNWTYEWTDLPLFADGAVAQYSLRESKIGDVLYDPTADPTDGYADYLVEQDPPQYRQGTTGDYRADATWEDADGNKQYADNALLVVHNSELKGTINFLKVDETGTKLPDARFGLYTDEECTQCIQEANSDDEGLVDFGSQLAGTYYIKEIAAPRGFELNTTVYKVIVTGGKATITVNGEENGTPVTRVENMSCVTLGLKKISASSGTALTGATFRMYKDGAEYKTAAVGQDGTIDFGKLEAGTYRVEEIEAPDGYRKLDGSVTLIIQDGAMKYANSTSADTKKAWNLTEGLNGSYTLTVENEILYDLPTAGGPGITPFVLLGTALMCLSIGSVFWIWRRKETDPT